MSKYNCLCICFIRLTTCFGNCGPSSGWPTVGTSKHNCLCICFIRLTTCFGNCGPSSGWPTVGTSKHNCLCICFIRLTTCFGHCGPSWGWSTVAKTCRRQPNKTDTKTVVFWYTYPLLILLCVSYHRWNLLWGLPTFIFSGYWGSFVGLNWPGH